MRLPVKGRIKLTQYETEQLNGQIIDCIWRKKKVLLSLDFDDTLLFLAESDRNAEKKPLLNEHLIVFLIELLQLYGPEHFELMILSARANDRVFEEKNPGKRHLLIQTALPIFLNRLFNEAGYSEALPEENIHCLMDCSSRTRTPLKSAHLRDVIIPNHPEKLIIHFDDDPNQLAWIQKELKESKELGNNYPVFCVGIEKEPEPVKKSAEEPVVAQHSAFFHSERRPQNPSPEGTQASATPVSHQGRGMYACKARDEFDEEENTGFLAPPPISRHLDPYDDRSDEEEDRRQKTC